TSSRTLVCRPPSSLPRSTGRTSSSSASARSAAMTARSLSPTQLPSIAVEDIGKCAYGIFKLGGGLVGQTIGVAGEHPTGAKIAAALTRPLGEEVRYNDVPPEVFR